MTRKEALKFLRKFPFIYRVTAKGIVFKKKAFSFIKDIPYKKVVSFTNTKDNYWAFPVHFLQNTFSDNARAVFELVKNDESITKIIFINNAKIDIPENVHTIIVDMNSPDALKWLSKCEVILVQHSLLLDYRVKSWSVRKLIFAKSQVVNLWHGVPFKYIQKQDFTSLAQEEGRYFHFVIASSFYDRLVLGNAFSPIEFERIKITGLPRFDFLLCEKNKLSPLYSQQLEKIISIKAGRKLILYAPTYRETTKGGDYYNFSKEEIDQLKEIAKRNNAIFGFRYHYFQNSEISFSHFIDGKYLFDFGQSTINDISMLLREADVVVTDYSGLFIDAMLLNKPLINFAYDVEHYYKYQRGFYLEILKVFPGPVSTNFVDLCNQIEESINNNGAVNPLNYNMAKNIFARFNDGENSKRVIDLIKTTK